MACKKHTQRKRPGSCPDCAAELKKDSTLVSKAGKDKPYIAEKTSREMLAELDAMEKEADELVIKPQRQKKIKIEHKEETLPASDAEISPECIKDIEEHIAKANIDKYFALKLAEFKSNVNALTQIQWEHLYIPMTHFRYNMIEDLEKVGFSYKDMWTGNVAQASGCKEDVAVLVRVKNPKWGPVPAHIKGKLR